PSRLLGEGHGDFTSRARTRGNREPRWGLLAPRSDRPRSADLTPPLSPARGRRTNQRDQGIPPYGHRRSIQPLSLRVSSLCSVRAPDARSLVAMGARGQGATATRVEKALLLHLLQEAFSAG